MDQYKWDASVNMMNGESLKSIINRVLRGKQYNRYIMGIKCDQRGKLTKENALTELIRIPRYSIQS